MNERTPPTLLPTIAAKTEALPEESAAATDVPAYTKPPRHDDPTRYGDWELSGKCVDF